ncbi:hypothetical protein GYMLUDRAFT_245991 [Collybiopsis luxurians FD-317 M1]|uniref:Uncharacterized protein n=1 Tax=Collybiopsis luxurians FD-317 M1 TaxID=944289 RepID=A0A0D0CSF1_9AGAR|nr:hypothetical protein GYMLUDRAFT_245991 [Collybiopsis luxurians FD-317 M1]
MSTSNKDDSSICSDESKPGYGCQKLFDHKPTPGLCVQCHYLSTLDTSSDEFKKMAAAPSCSGCGAIVMFMAPGTTLCGSCKWKVTTQSSAEKSAVDLQASKHAARADAVAKQTLPKAAVHVTPKPSPHVAADAVGGWNIRVFLIPIARGTLVSSKIFIASSTFSEKCIEHLLGQWNLTWKKDSSESLTRDHISLCLYVRLAILPGSDLETVGHFYDVHESILPADINKCSPSTVQTDKNPFIYLEGVLNILEKTGAVAPTWAHTEKELEK